MPASGITIDVQEDNVSIVLGKLKKDTGRLYGLYFGKKLRHGGEPDYVSIIRISTITKV